MIKDDLVYIRGPEGAYLIVDVKVAEEFGYKDKPPGEVSCDKLAQIRRRQEEFNVERRSKKVPSEAVSVPGTAKRNGVGAGVGGMLGPDNGETLRGDGDVQPSPGPETDGSDLEGGGSLGDLQTDEVGREAGDVYVPAVILARDSTGEGNHHRERKPEAIAVPV